MEEFQQQSLPAWTSVLYCCMKMGDMPSCCAVQMKIFFLKRYREEIGKDYNNKTFYLCCQSDFDKSDPVFGDASCSNSITVDSNDGSDDLTTAGADSIEQKAHGEYEPAFKHKRSESSENENANPLESEDQLKQSEQTKKLLYLLKNLSLLMLVRTMNVLQHSLNLTSHHLVFWVG